MIGLALALGLLVPAPPAPTPAADTRAVEAVVVRKDGRAVRATFARAPEPEQLADADHVWLWSASAPPVRLAADAVFPSFEKVRSNAGDTAPARLEVKSFLPGGKRGRGVRVIAAPAAMWDEVPEDLLPSWVAGEGGAVTLPRSKEPYRIRAVAPGAGSAWAEVAPRARSAAVTLHPATDLRILVTNRERRELDAVLRLSDSEAQMREPHPVAVFRAERGAILLPSAPLADLAAVFEAEDHVPLALSGRLPDLPRNVVLEPGATVRGRFVDGQKAPVAGAEVMAEWWASPTVERVMTRATASAADGAWILRGVPLRTLAITVERAGFARIQRSLEPDGPVIDLGTIVLAPAVQLAVRVLGPDREPVQDAAVALSPQREVKTGADGVARFTGLARNEPLRLVVTAPGYLRQTEDVPAPLPAEHRITLPKSFRVTGRYVLPDGQPVPGAALKVMAGGRDSRRDLESDGSFDLDLQPELAAELMFVAPAARELRLPVEAGRAGETRDLGEIHPLPGATVVGKALSAVDLQPVGGARVWALRPSTLPLLAWARGDVLEARTAPDGSFVLSGGEPSPMLLRIDAAGHARAYRTVEPRAGEEQADAGEIHLTEGTTLRVLAADDNEGATARADLRGEWFDADVLSAEVRDGVATLRHVPAGPVLVAVRSGGALVCEKSVDVPPDTESLDVDCTEGPPLVRGQVLVGGEPASGMLRWSRAVRQTESIILNRASPAGLPRQRVVGETPQDVTLQTDDEGRFETSDLRPGPWSVAWLPDHGGTSPSRSITIEERGEQFVTLQFGTGAVQGLVVDDTEAPVEGAGVGIEEAEGGATTGPDGTFSIDGLQPGTYRLRARTPKRSSGLVTATIDDSGRSEPVRLKLDRDATEEVVIEVAGRNGEPAAGALVLLETEDGTLPLATADVNGKARFPLLPHVTRFRAAALHGGDWAFGAWAARGDRTLQIGETGALVVTAEELSGPVRLVEGSGWDVTALLARLGAGKILAPGRPADFRGLPPGSYAIAVGDARASAAVKAGESVQAKIR
jgi:hypothetical protein